MISILNFSQFNGFVAKTLKDYLVALSKKTSKSNPAKKADVGNLVTIESRFSIRLPFISFLYTF